MQKKPAGQIWEAGWDMELGYGWRKKPGGKKADREAAFALEDDAYLQDEDYVEMELCGSGVPPPSLAAICLLSKHLTLIAAFSLIHFSQGILMSHLLASIWKWN